MVFETSRADPRHPHRAWITLKIDGHAESQRLQTADISKGGLFVAASQPLERGTKVVVRFEQALNPPELPAQVVHVRTAAMATRLGVEPGMGLMFMGLSLEQREWMNRYVETHGSWHTPARPGAAGQTAAELLKVARTVVAGVEMGDLWGAASLTPDASEPQIRARLDALADMFSKPLPGMTASEQTRLTLASVALRRLNALRDPQARASVRPPRAEAKPPMDGGSALASGKTPSSPGRLPAVGLGTRPTSPPAPSLPAPATTSSSRLPTSSDPVTRPGTGKFPAITEPLPKPGSGKLPAISDPLSKPGTGKFPAITEPLPKPGAGPGSGKLPAVADPPARTGTGRLPAVTEPAPSAPSSARLPAVTPPPATTPASSLVGPAGQSRWGREEKSSQPPGPVGPLGIPRPPTKDR